MALLSRFFRVTGLVQGVGFRPTVYRIAIALNLKGEVFNDAQGVGIHLEGEAESLDAFEPELRRNAPTLCRIDSVCVKDVPFVGYKDFVITPSRAGTVTTAITPDAATCQACLADMFDSSNRRYRYAFTNCTHCGPRYTITRHLPYDRPQTSMARFAMCAKCRTEYTDPLDRRFHAQPNACPVCGPHLSLLRADKTPVAGDPIDETVRALRDGAIVAVKGLGGFHLACDARNSKAIATLRLRKHRDEKPFAVMVANVASARLFVQVNDAAQALLEGIERPIVLLPKKPELDLPGLADALDGLGERRDDLFLAAHDARQVDVRAASVLLEGLADERLWRTREEQVRRFLQDVRDHDEAEVEALLVADVLHRFDELRLEIHDFLRVHDRDLADDDAVVADLELLEVVLGDLSRRHVADAGTSLEHRHAVFLDIDAG